MQHIWQFDSPKGFASAVTPPPPELASERLMKQWEAAGVFWHPETPKDEYPGRITFTPGAGTSVILEGNLFKDPGHIGADIVPTLHGRLFDGTPCSLFSCQCFLNTYDFDGQFYFRTKCFSDLSVVGGWWPGVDARTLKSLRVRFSHLDQWFKAPYSIRHKRDRSKSLLSFKSDRLTADFNFKGVEVQLESLCERQIPDDATPEGAAWPFRYDVLLHPKTEQSIQWFLDLAASLRDLFVFLIGSGVYILDLVGKDKDTPPNQRPKLSVNYPVTVPRVVRLAPRYFSTFHADYKECMPTVVRAWFAQQRDLQVATSTYTELLCADGASRETIFLRTVQTLEHLHGLLWPNDSRYAKPATFTRFVRWLRCHFPQNLEHVPSDEMSKFESKKEILLGRIGGLNNLSFRSRLEKIFDEIPSHRRLTLFDAPPTVNMSLQCFLEHLEATRNYLTHFNEEDKKLAFPRERIEGREKIEDRVTIEDAALTCWAALTFWISRRLELDENQAGDMAFRAKNALFVVHSRSTL